MIGSFAEGALGFSETDLPEVVPDEYGGLTVGDWTFDPVDDGETDEWVLGGIKAFMAYWLWRQRNPDDLSQYTTAGILYRVSSLSRDKTKELAERLAAEGYKIVPVDE